MTSTFLSGVLLLVSLLVSGVWAQADDMAACPPGWEWNQNSLGQDPCTVGATLDASCRGNAVYTWGPLGRNDSYYPPRVDHNGDLDCDCNTVMYNLFMACTSCQAGFIDTWPTYIAVCETVYITQYPSDIAQGTAVPRWAFFNITTAPNQVYSDATAMGIGRDPEEFPRQLNTLSSSKSTSTRTSSNRPSATGSTSNDSSSKTNVGAIVGGVVGSVVFFTILAIVAFIYARHRRRKQENQQRWMQSPDEIDPHKLHGSPMTSVPFAPYSPSDPSAIPPLSPKSSVAYTTPGQNHPNGRGGYTGAPEV